MSNRTPKTLRAVDLCCSVGGWACAARGLPIEFVAVCDLDARRLQTWRHNHSAAHPRCAVLRGNLQFGMLDVRDFERVDLVLGGIPCAEICTARHAKRAEGKSLDDWRALLDSVLAYVGRVKPRWWAIEDVTAIEKELPLALWHGSDIPYRRINAADFGPQSRVRTFLGVFPDPVPTVTDEPSLGSYLSRGPHRLTEYALRRGVREHRDAVEPNTIHVCRGDEKCPTITNVSSHRDRWWIVDDPRCGHRQLTWQEAARIQGFPEDFVFVGNPGEVAQHIADAIPIQVGRAILEAIVEKEKVNYGCDGKTVAH